MIGIVKERSVRTFETGTKRVQFWKTMLDVAPLADVQDTTFIKQQCQAEMGEAIEAVSIESNKFVRKISGLLAFGIGALLVFSLARIGLEVLELLQQRGASVQEANEAATISAMMQATAYTAVWFWGRVRVKRWIWYKIKPGGQFDFVRNNVRWQGGVGLLLSFLRLGCSLAVRADAHHKALTTPV